MEIEKSVYIHSNLRAILKLIFCIKNEKEREKLFFFMFPSHTASFQPIHQNEILSRFLLTFVIKLEVEIQRKRFCKAMHICAHP